MSAPGQEITLLESLFAQDPGGRVFLPLGQAYLEAGRPSQAAAVLEQGLKLHPGEIKGRHLLAQAWVALGQRDKALEELLLADRFMREAAGVYQMLSELLPGLGRGSEGLRAAILARELKAELTAPLEAAPDAPPPEPSPPPTETATLARIYADQGMTEEALAIRRRLGLPAEARADWDPAPEAAAPSRPTAAQSRRGAMLRRLESLRAAALARAGQA